MHLTEKEKEYESRGDGSVRLASAAGRWAVAVAVLGDAMILLEATVVNVALRAVASSAQTVKQ